MTRTKSNNGDNDESYSAFVGKHDPTKHFQLPLLLFLHWPLLLYTTRHLLPKTLDLVLHRPFERFLPVLPLFAEGFPFWCAAVRQYCSSVFVDYL